MTFIKKAIAFALTVIIMFTVLAACQSQQGKDDTKNAADISEAQSQKEAPVVLVWPNVDEGYSSMMSTDAAKQVHDKILDILNIDLQPVFYPSDQYNNRVNMLIASGDQVDIIPRVTRAQSIEYFNDEVIIELTDLINKHAPDYLAACETYDFIAKAREEAKFQGKDLVMPWPTLVPRAQTLQVRTDWLEKLNMAVPTTLEEFEAYLEAVKTQDPDGNGQNDTYGLSAGVWGANLVNIMSMFYCPAGWENWLDENGRLQIAELHPNYKLLLEDLTRWYKAGYLPPEVFTSADDQRNDWVTSNKVGALATWYSAPISGIITLRQAVPEATYTPICIKGKPEAANALRNENATPNSPVITASSKHPIEAMKFLNFLYSKEGQILTVWGIENVSYKLIDGQPDSILGEDGTKQYYAAYNPQLGIPQLSLKEKNIIVFVRSVFLQGLFFLDPVNLPPKVQIAREPLLLLRKLAEKEGMSIAQLAIAYIRDIDGVCSLVLGVETSEQIAENIRLINTPAISEKTRYEIETSFRAVPILDLIEGLK